MRILAIGDIHGCSKALETLLAAVAPQPEYSLFWDGFDESQPHISGKIMVCGHLSQKSGNPVNLGHAICLDTWACGEGWLTCWDVNSGRVWQANQKCQQRTTKIDKYKINC